MWFPFFGKKEKRAFLDPVIKEQLEQTTVRREQDAEARKERLEVEYPSAMSAIEDYRKGYLTEEQLEVRFSPDEIETIHHESDKRNREDGDMPTAGYA